MTRESNSTSPSSRTSAGILPSGFCRRSESAGSNASATSAVMRPSRPRTIAAMRTLRPKGDAEAERRIIGFGPCGKKSPPILARGAGEDNPSLRVGRAMSEPAASARDDEVDGLRPLALLVGLHVEADALAFVERFQAGPLHRSNVHEYVAPAVVRLDEAIAAFAIKELDRTGHCHRETPPRGCSAVGPHGATARLDIHRREKLRPFRPRTYRRLPKEVERQSPA